MKVFDLWVKLANFDKDLEVVLYSPLDGDGCYVSTQDAEKKTVVVDRGAKPRAVVIIF